MRAIDVELAVVKLLGIRKHFIVPNVSWGLALSHECDLLVLDKQRRFTEIEIKVSKSDLKADFNKPHGHNCKCISRLAYAFPETLLDTALELVPKQYGLISVKEKYREGYKIPSYTAKWERMCKHNDKRPEQWQIDKFFDLSTMRIWSLKNHLRQMTIGKDFIKK